MRKKKSLIDRFKTKYIINSQTNCWEWIGACYVNGYGNMMLEKGKITGAHRVSWLIYKGEISKNKNVCHKCDNVRCVNPDHLFLGTQKDNLRDMTIKGRRRSNPPKGSKNKSSKLKENNIIEIRKLYTPYIITRDYLAKKYKVTRRVINLILANKSWRHV